MDKIPATINQVFDQLALRFGATGGYLWHIIVREQLIEGVIGTVICSAILYAVYRLFQKTFEIEDDEDRVFAWVPLCIVGLIAAIVLACYLSQLLNPEYYALTTVMSMVKGK